MDAARIVALSGHDASADPDVIWDDPVSPVKAVGLKEALKVRVITKGSPYLGFALKPLQVFLWRNLYQHDSDVFRLIGQPVDEQIVQDKMGARLRGGEAYLSGDYSGATNNLDPRISEMIADAIIKVCDLDLVTSKLFKASLVGNSIIGRDGSIKKQQWGQLMGSVVSFPVLCVANAVVCQWAMEVDVGQKLTLEKLPLLINGDDCLLRCTKTGLEAWKRISSFVGLSPSLGKFFFSREFADINSTSFRRRETPFRAIYKHSRRREYSDLWKREVQLRPVREWWFEQVPFINAGLLYGMKRSEEHDTAAEKIVAGDPDLRKSTTLGSLASGLVSSCPTELAPTVLELFIHKNLAALRAAKVPWFVPQEWGGVGLPPIVERHADFLNDPADETTFAKDSHGRPLGPDRTELRAWSTVWHHPELFQVGRPPLAVPWLTHRIAMARFPVDNIPLTPEQYDRHRRAYGLLCVDALFSGGELFTKNPADTALKLLHRNQRNWSRAHRHGLSRRLEMQFSRLSRSVPVHLGCPIVA